MRLETQMEGVREAVDRQSGEVQKIRVSLDELRTLVSATHAACIKHEDLQEAERRVEARVVHLETFRDRVKRYAGIGGALGAGALGILTLFGPSRVAEAWRQLWS